MVDFPGHLGVIRKVMSHFCLASAPTGYSKSWCPTSFLIGKSFKSSINGATFHSYVTNNQKVSWLVKPNGIWL